MAGGKNAERGPGDLSGARSISAEDTLKLDLVETDIHAGTLSYLSPPLLPTSPFEPCPYKYICAAVNAMLMLA